MLILINISMGQPAGSKQLNNTYLSFYIHIIEKLKIVLCHLLRRLFTGYRLMNGLILILIKKSDKESVTFLLAVLLRILNHT